MKLHLPKRLLTALLAAFTAISLSTGSASGISITETTKTVTLSGDALKGTYIGNKFTYTGNKVSGSFTSLNTSSLTLTFTMNNAAALTAGANATSDGAGLVYVEKADGTDWGFQIHDADASGDGDAVIRGRWQDKYWNDSTTLEIKSTETTTYTAVMTSGGTGTQLYEGSSVAGTLVYNKDKLTASNATISSATINTAVVTEVQIQDVWYTVSNDSGSWVQDFDSSTAVLTGTGKHELRNTAEQLSKTNIIVGNSTQLFLQSWTQGGGTAIETSSNIYIGKTTFSNDAAYVGVALRFGNDTDSAGGRDITLHGNIYLVEDAKIKSNSTNEVYINGVVTDVVNGVDTGSTLTIEGQGYQFANRVEVNGLEIVGTNSKIEFTSTSTLQVEQTIHNAGTVSLAGKLIFNSINSENYELYPSSFFQDATYNSNTLSGYGQGNQVLLINGGTITNNATSITGDGLSSATVIAGVGLVGTMEDILQDTTIFYVNENIRWGTAGDGSTYTETVYSDTTAATYVIAENQTLDIYGNYFAGKNFILATGATLTNEGTGLAENAQQFQSITLTGNATVNTANNMGILRTDGAATQLNLNGNKLTKTGANTLFMVGTTVLGGGTIQVNEGTIQVGVDTTAGNTADVTADKTHFVLSGSSNLIIESAGNTLTAASLSGSGNVTGAGSLILNGTGTYTFSGDVSVATLTNSTNLTVTGSASSTSVTSTGNLIFAGNYTTGSNTLSLNSGDALNKGIQFDGRLEASAFSILGTNESGPIGFVKFFGDVQATGGLHTRRAAITFGNGTTKGSAVLGSMEMGDSNASGNHTVTISNNYTVAVTGNNNNSSDYRNVTLLLGEWNTKTTMDVTGSFLAENATMFLGNVGGTLNVNNGGTVAVQGIKRAKNDINPTFTLNLAAGGTLVLGTSGLSVGGTGEQNYNLAGGTVGISAENVTIGEDIKLNGSSVRFDSSLYTFTNSGTQLERGANGGTLTVTGAVSGTGKLVAEGSGNVVFTGDMSDFAGLIEVQSGGTLTIGDANGSTTTTLGLVGTIINNGTLNLNTDLNASGADIFELYRVTDADGHAVNGFGTGISGEYIVATGGEIMLKNDALIYLGDSSTGTTLSKVSPTTDQQLVTFTHSGALENDVYYVSTSAKTSEIEVTANQTLSRFHVVGIGELTADSPVTLANSTTKSLLDILSTTTGNGTIKLSADFTFGTGSGAATVFSGDWKVAGGTLTIGSLTNNQANANSSSDVSSLRSIILDGGNLKYQGTTGTINAISAKNNADFTIFDMTASNGEGDKLTINTVSIAEGKTLTINNASGGSYKHHLSIGALEGNGSVAVYGPGNNKWSSSQISRLSILSLEDFTGSLTVTSREGNNADYVDNDVYHAIVNTGVNGASLNSLEFVGFGESNENSSAVFNVQSDTSIGILNASGSTVNLEGQSKLTLGGGTQNAPIVHSIKTVTGGSGSMLNLAENAVLNTISSADGVTLTGSGTYELAAGTTTMTTGISLHDTLWQGAVRISGGNNGTAWGTFSGLYKASSKVALNRVVGHLSHETDITANLILEEGLAIDVQNGTSGGTTTFIGSLEGEGNFQFTGWSGRNNKLTYKFYGNLSDWSGCFINNSDQGHDVELQFLQSGTASEPAEIFAYDNTDTSVGITDTNANNSNLNVTIGDADNTTAVVNFNGIIENTNKLTLYNQATFTRSVSVTTMEVKDKATASLNANSSIGALNAATASITMGQNVILTLGGGSADSRKTHSVGALSAGAGTKISLGDYAILSFANGTETSQKVNTVGSITTGAGAGISLGDYATLKITEVPAALKNSYSSGNNDASSSVSLSITGGIGSVLDLAMDSTDFWKNNNTVTLVQGENSDLAVRISSGYLANSVFAANNNVYTTTNLGGSALSMADGTSLVLRRVNSAENFGAGDITLEGTTNLKLYGSVRKDNTNLTNNITGGTLNIVNDTTTVDYTTAAGITLTGNLNLTKLSNQAREEVVLSGESMQFGTLEVKSSNGSTTTINGNATADSVSVQQGTLKLGATATITKAEVETATSMENVKLSEEGIASADETKATKGSVADAKVSLAALAAGTSFSIEDVTLFNVNIEAANAGDRVNLSGVTATDVQLTKGEFHMLDKAQPQVGTGGSAINLVEGGPTGLQFSTSLLNGMTLGADASMVVDLGDLSGFTGMDSGKPTFSITLEGFRISGFDIDTYLAENPGIYFAADSWLGQLLVAQGASQYVKGDSLEAGAQAAAGSGSGVSVSYNSTAVGTVIIISGLQVPEPASATLGLAALMMLCARRRRRA